MQINLITSNPGKLKEFKLILGDEVEINHINKEINHPFHIHDLYLPLSASLGIAQYPKDGKSSDTLLHFADKNMYSNKYRKIS